MTASNNQSDDREIAPVHLSAQEFAELSGLSIATVRRYLADGRLPKIQLGGPRCRVLIPRDALDALVITSDANNQAIEEQCETTGDSEKPDRPALSGPCPRWRRPRR